MSSTQDFSNPFLPGAFDPLWHRGALLIKLRWGVFLLSFGMLVFVSAFGDMFGFDKGTLAIACSILGLANFIFYMVHASLHAAPRTEQRAYVYRILFLVEVVCDYALVTFLIYRLGFLYLNLSLLYLPHVILSAVMLEKRTAGALVTVGSIVIIAVLCLIKADEINPAVSGLKILHTPVPGAAVYFAFNSGIIAFVSMLAALTVGAMTKRRLRLRRTLERLAELDREKQSYTLRATHELKAPFAAIQSYTQLIMAGYLGEVPPKMRDVVVKINNRCEGLSKMIKNIIQLSNLRTTLFKNEDFMPLDLRQMVSDRITLISERPDIVEANVQVVVLPMKEYGEDDEEPSVRGIRELLEILVDNIVSNAVHYAPAGTVVEVAVEFPEVDDVTTLVVKDRGMGIPQDALPRIFEEHYRCENAQASRPSGNGMGLAIVKEIIRLHRGSVSVDSELEVGTTMAVTIPLFPRTGGDDNP